MKIAILTLGTRGDVQPYAALGRALRDRGHQVTLSTGKNFQELIKSYEIDFVPVDLDFQELVNSEQARELLKKPLNAIGIAIDLKNKTAPLVIDALRIFYDLSKWADKVLFHAKTMAESFSDQFPEKMIKANLVPAIQPTSAFANPIFSALPLPPFLNKLTYKLTDLGLKMWSKPIKEFRRSVGLPTNFAKQQLISIYGISELLLKKPNDFPDNSHFTGFWLDKSDTKLQHDIADFIQQGDPPLLITFGSMLFNNKINLPQLIKTISENLNVRIIVVQGWGLTETEILKHDANIKVIQSAPYDLLFPLVRAVIHHGGIGTIASCLKAGKPFLTCPVLHPLGDQYFWGILSRSKGVAEYPLPLKEITETKLLERVSLLLGNEHLYDNAMLLAEQLSGEDGISNAITIIEN